MRTGSSINQGLVEYASYLLTESSIAVNAYREFIRAIAINGERYPIPEFTLTCMRDAAQHSINSYRLAQIALIAHTYDPEIQSVLAKSCERTSSVEDETMDILSVYHDRCLEILND
jgi:hypothetical protein